MLTKLLKYEWKSSGKLTLLLNAYIVLITVLGVIMIQSGLLEQMMNTMASEAEAKSSVLGIVGSVLIFTYVISIIAVSVAVCLFQIFRFYKNYYTDEGYLMHTLPVTPNQLILSKGIFAFVATLLTGVIVIVSVFSIILTSCPVDERVQFFTEMRKVLPEISQECGFSSGMLIFIGTLHVIVTGVHSILAFYAALSIGQLFEKHKIMGSILAYGIICTIEQTVCMISMLLITPHSSALYARISLIYPLVFSSITSIAFWFITSHIMKNKLNLE